MTTTTAINLDETRTYVINSYNTAKGKNLRDFKNGDDMATSEYIYPNQRSDAAEVVGIFNSNPNCVAVSIKKNVKVGADGFMIELAKNMCTHPDDNFVTDPNNIQIITGMNNRAWQDELRRKVPCCFKENIFHHGQLKHVDLLNISNAVIIIDEIDSASKEEQHLHKILRDAKLMDLEMLKENNIKLIFISATLSLELTQLRSWGDAHINFTLTTPDTYCGIEYFMKNNIAKESCSLTTDVNIDNWIKEDIVDKYGTDYRVHLVRLPVGKKCFNSKRLFEEISVKYGIQFHLHTSNSRLGEGEFSSLFTAKRETHIIIALQGLYRRATRIPDNYKLHIGAVHVSRSAVADNNVIAQDLIGRMCGYYKSELDAGHVIGPIRSPLKALNEYIADFNGDVTAYQTAGLKKGKNGDIKKIVPTMIDANHWGKDAPALVVKKDSTDKASKVFAGQADAILFARDHLKIKINKRTKTLAPDVLLIDGKNPSHEYVMNRMWGINEKSKVRMMILDTGDWCLYWRPSLI